MDIGSSRPGTRPSGGGAARDFLQNSPSRRPGEAAGNRQDLRDNRSDRIGNRQDNVGDRRDARGDRSNLQQDRRQNLSSNRANRIDNVQQHRTDRVSRRDQVRDQFRDNHPRYDFWKDNPNWARWRWNRPYRWATWAAAAAWFPWGWNDAFSYSYGETVYYEDNTVYYDNEPVATAEEYAEQAQGIVAGAPEPSDDDEWMTLGVFAITQDGASSGPPPTMFLQLAVNKQGVIAGTFQNTQTDKTFSVEGAVDRETQRTAWVPSGEKWPVMETGLSNLTKDQAPALIHFEDGQTQQWLMVHVEEPQAEQ